VEQTAEANSDRLEQQTLERRQRLSTYQQQQTLGSVFLFILLSHQYKTLLPDRTRKTTTVFFFCDRASEFCFGRNSKMKKSTLT